MKLFDDKGYPNIDAIIDNGESFNLATGGRGTGKTVSTLATFIRREIPFIWMRRTQKECDLIGHPEFSDITRYNEVFGMQCVVKKVTKNNSIVTINKDSDKPIAVTCSLAGLSGMRGINGRDKDWLFYDEFIPEKSTRKMTGEGDAFLNAFETLNRNRELEGDAPLKLMAHSNSNNLSNELYLALGVVINVENMIRKQKEFVRLTKRHLMLLSYHNSPISAAKKNTVLYEMLGEENSYYKMAINNEFSYNDFGNIKSCNIAEYKPLVGLGELCIYIHKHRQELYVTSHRTGTVEYFNCNTMGLKRFIRKYRWIWDAHINQIVFFENFLCQSLFERYLS